MADPRPLPALVALELGAATQAHPGFYAYLVDAAEDGFSLSAPSDHDLSEADWERVADLRLRSLFNAFRRSQQPPSNASTPPAGGGAS